MTFPRSRALPSRRTPVPSSRPMRQPALRVALALLLAGSTLGLAGCFPVLATGVAVGAIAATDRRTLATQAEDQSIELKAPGRLRDALRQPNWISVNAYNRRVLMTGQVASEEERRAAEQAVARIENVRQVHNETYIAPQPATFGSNASDSTITARVRTATLRELGTEVNQSAFMIVTERSVVHLMGLVTRREGDRIAEVASRVGGVSKVVTLFEYITDDDRSRLENAPAPAPASARPAN